MGLFDSPNAIQPQQQSLYGPLSGTTQVSRRNIHPHTILSLYSLGFWIG